MEDYIDVLLNWLQEAPPEQPDAALCQQETAAMDALCSTLSKEQRACFLRYEDARNATAGAVAEALARQAFLLAKTIYR